MRKQYRSALMASIHETAEGLHAARLMDKRTMREFDELCLTQAPKLVALAEKYPKDPIALDALIEAVWQGNTVPWPVELVGRDEARPRAFALLLRDHLASDRLGPLCERISYGLCAEYETFLRAVLEKNPHEAVRARQQLLEQMFGLRSKETRK